MWPGHWIATDNREREPNRSCVPDWKTSKFGNYTTKDYFVSIYPGNGGGIYEKTPGPNPCLWMPGDVPGWSLTVHIGWGAQSQEQGNRLGSWWVQVGNFQWKRDLWCFLLRVRDSMWTQYLVHNKSDSMPPHSLPQCLIQKELISHHTTSKEGATSWITSPQNFML